MNLENLSDPNILRANKNSIQVHSKYIFFNRNSPIKDPYIYIYTHAWACKRFFLPLEKSLSTIGTKRVIFYSKIKTHIMKRLN